MTGTGLCLDCWHDLCPIANPCCAACGRPLVYAMLDSLYAPCLIKPFPLHRIKAGFCYDAASRQLILPFKHADRIDITSVMAAMLGPVFRQLAHKTDIFIPVPLHARRYIKRRYNQSAELARWLCQQHRICPAIFVAHQISMVADQIPARAKCPPRLCHCPSNSQSLSGWQRYLIDR